MGIAQLQKFTMPACIAILMAGFATSIAAQQITQFLVPGESNAFPAGINNSGDVTGYYCPAGNCLNARGFVRESNGSIAVFDGIPSGINDEGTVAGRIGRFQGFLRDKKGAITVFDVPQLFGSHDTVTGPFEIDNNGEIAGWVACAPACSEWFYGLLRDKHGAMTTFFVPPQGLSPNSINARGDITGWNKIDIFQLRGFVRNARSGEITTFEVPGVPGPSCGPPYVNPTSINNAGDIAGWYRQRDCTAATRTRGFVRARNGAITTFDAAPDSTTEPASINEGGDITGNFSDPNGRHHFVRNANGNITIFDVPDGDGTVTSMNNRGDVAGSFTVFRNGTFLTYGFLRKAH